MVENYIRVSSTAFTEDRKRVNSTVYNVEYLKDLINKEKIVFLWNFSLDEIRWFDYQI